MLKEINHHATQHVLTNDMMSRGMARGRYGFDTVKAKALHPNPVLTHATEVFWGTSIGVSKYELRVIVASFGKYTTLVEEANFFTEPIYVTFVRITCEKAQSAGLAVGQYLKVKTRVLQCTTGDPTNDSFVRDRIDTLPVDSG